MRTSVNVVSATRRPFSSVLRFIAIFTPSNSRQSDSSMSYVTSPQTLS